MLNSGVNITATVETGFKPVSHPATISHADATVKTGLKPVSTKSRQFKKTADETGAAGKKIVQKTRHFYRAFTMSENNG